jgi:hypothetical protein
MLSTNSSRSDRAFSSVPSEGDTEIQFDIAHGELRRALIRGIGHRVGKAVDNMSIEEARSDIPLAELYHRKLRSNRSAGLVERLLLRWWR